MKNSIATALSLFALGVTAPAFAQSAPSPAAPAAATEAAPAQAAAAKAGDTIYDQAGEVVGTVESVEGSNFVISTGANKATVPLSALAAGPKGHVIGMTKAQLDEAIKNANGGGGSTPAQK